MGPPDKLPAGGTNVCSRAHTVPPTKCSWREEGPTLRPLDLTTNYSECGEVNQLTP